MDRLDEEQQALAEEAIDRAKRIAERYARIFPAHADDFESAACWGAVRAASTYMAEKYGQWDRWSGLCIRGEIKDFLDNSYLKRRQDWSMDAMIRVVDDAQAARLSDEADAIDYLLSLLPDRHRALCSLIYKMGMSPCAAGKALGYSNKHGAKLHDLALEHLRKRLTA